MNEECRYIFSKGDLYREDDSIIFRLDENSKKINIPIYKVKEIYCFNDMTLTTKLISLIGKKHIIIHFYDYYGNYVGTFYPKDNYLSGKLVLKQVECYNTKRLIIAKSIVSGISKNIYDVLYHYMRHGKTELKDYLKFLKKDIPNLLNKCNNIKQVLEVEGHIWRDFYSTFELFLPLDFVMNKRVRKPPNNPMNALISFGNSILYSKTITQIYQTHLNQTISFLHEPSDGRFSLSLDICEVFKPIIVFKTIFYCVNNKMLQVEKHFEKDLNYCILNEDGKKIFLEELDKRLNEVFEHPLLHRKVSYKQCIKLDCYKLIKYIMEDKDFIPFYIGDKK